MHTKRILALAALFALAGCSPLYDHFGGKFTGEPSEIAALMKEDKKAKELIDAAFAFTSVKGGATPVDHHVHVVSTGAGLAGLCGRKGDTTSTVTQKRFTWLRPIRKIKTSVLMSASGITDIHQADEQYAARLLDLVVYFPGPGRFHLLALDAYLDENGTVDKDKTDMYISNDYVVELSKCLIGLLEKKTRALPERFKKDKRFAPMISV
ncbi:MAG: hypothetical protein V3V56_00995, partial [bacterium]